MSEGEASVRGDHATTKAVDVAREKPTVPRPRCAALGVKQAYIFVPQADITVAELSESVELVAFGLMSALRGTGKEQADVLYGAMSDGGKRHWKIHEMATGPKIAVPRGCGGVRPGLKFPPGVK